jgi:MFS family permease
MTAALVDALAFALAVTMAMRSTWSPCGISMLSTITPLGERGRGHRYGMTVAWFVAGAIVGGAVLGGALAAIAAVVGLADLSPTSVAAVVMVAALITMASDLSVGGFRLPRIPRQVDENWTGRYRHWVYAAGFGAQIGVGVSTYVMTAGVYLMMLLAGLTGRPVVALFVGLSFGLVRGLAILLGVRLTTPEAIRAFHRRFESAGTLSLQLAVIAQLNVFVVALSSWLDASYGVALLVVNVPMLVRYLVDWSAPRWNSRRRSA